MWTYATCGMSAGLGENAVELYLFSPIQAPELVELLTVVVGTWYLFGETESWYGTLSRAIRSRSSRIPGRTLRSA
jgi:hypothetical protein